MSIPSSTTPAVALPGGRRALSYAAALYLQGSIVLTFLAASTAPSPLYALYRQMWGFSPLTLTVVFASYALALLASLLVFGRASDHLGRRRVTLIALALEAMAMAMFWRADSVAWLLAARVLQGVATGVMTSAVSASLLDLNPAKGSLVNSVAPLFGMAVGAVGSAALVQFGTAPTQTVYVGLLLLFAAQGALAFWLPETAAGRPGLARSLTPRVAVATAARPTMWRVMPVNLAQWALGGFMLSLGPTLVRQVSTVASPLLGGALIASVVLPAAITVFAARHREAGAAVHAGAVLVALGAATLLGGIALQTTLPLFVGAVIAGIGFGAVFNGSVRGLVAVTAPSDRAGMMSAFFVLSYLAFSVPAMLAGLSAGRFGLIPTAKGYMAILVLLAAVVFLRTRWATRPRKPGAAEPS